MPENNNNNNNIDNSNLFTQMFGLESEQPPTPQTEPPTIPPTEPPKIESTSKPVIENKTPEQPVISPAPEIAQTPLFQHDLASELNQHPEETPTQDSQSDVMILSPTTEEKKEELIELSNTPLSSEPTNEEQIVDKFDPNAIPKEPYNYVQNSNFQTEEELPNINFNGSGLKIALVLIGVVVLICGWFYFYNIVLNPVENPPTPNQDTEEVEGAEKEEPEKKPEEETPKINFDQSLSFYKGLVDNENELNQELPYEPSAKTGVIKCDLIKPTSTQEGVTINLDIYLYYENYLLKKSYVQQTTNFKDKTLFNTNVKGLENAEKNFSNSESLTIDIQSDSSTQTIKFGMFSNLAYGSYTNANQAGLTLKVKFNYDDRITKAMSTVYGLDGMAGNIKCSSVKTS